MGCLGEMFLLPFKIIPYLIVITFQGMVFCIDLFIRCIDGIVNSYRNSRIRVQQQEQYNRMEQERINQEKAKEEEMKRLALERKARLEEIEEINKEVKIDNEEISDFSQKYIEYLNQVENN